MKRIDGYKLLNVINSDTFIKKRLQDKIFQRTILWRSFYIALNNCAKIDLAEIIYAYIWKLSMFTQ